MKVVSLFSGCGGLDLGFKQAGFDFLWANEFDPKIYPTFGKNFPKVELDTRSITNIKPSEIPNCDGIIGGPPCQSWSAFGKGRGMNDPRGKLINSYIKIIEAKRPKFFLAENVQGILFERHRQSLNKILNAFLNLGYNVNCLSLNASDYGVAQSRKRVFIVGYASSFDEHFFAPEKNRKKMTLKDVIYDLRKNAVSGLKFNKRNPKAKIKNHEYFHGSFSSHYMSRNRVKEWEDTSFTIQASGRHAPCHPDSPKMKKIKKDVCVFESSKTPRRLTIRECATIQSFPKNFKFDYLYLNDGYKMIGNAVPVKVAKKIALQIKKDFLRFDNLPINFKKKGKLIKSF